MNHRTVYCIVIVSFLIGLPIANDAQSASCEEEGSAWFNDKVSGDAKAGAPASHVIIFNHNGGVCARQDQARDGRGEAKAARITQGDNLYFGLYGRLADISALRRKISNCSLEGTAPNILDAAIDSDGRLLSDDKVLLRKLPLVECFDDQIDVQFLKANNSVAFSETFRQYQRFRATWQVGAMWTTLDDPEFTTTDFGSGPVIRATNDNSRGPEYTASLVLYGLPHYLGTLFDNSKSSYGGRDIVNDNMFADRLGLFLTVGLSEPKETLGVGLSFEIANGFNLTVAQLYRRISQLDGVSLGDAFAGTAVQIPTKTTWEEEFVVGLSIDGRYLAKFFGGGGNN